MDNTSIRKFREHISKKEKDTKSKLGNDKKAYGVFSQLLKIVEEKNLEGLISLKRYLPPFIDKIDAFEKTCKYLIDNNLRESPQYASLEKRLFSEELLEYIKKEQEKIKTEISRKEDVVEEYKKLSSDNYSNSFLYKILENGSFTEEEELDVLISFIKKTCVEEKEIENDYEEEVKEENISDVKIEEAKEDYEKIKAIVHNILNNSQYEMRELDVEQRKSIKKYLEILEKENEKPNDKTIIWEKMTCSDLRRITSLYSIEDNVKSVESFLYGEDEIKDEETLELIKMLISDIRKNVRIFLDSTTEVKKEDYEENNPEPSNVVFLLDEEGLPYIDKKIKTEDDKKLLSRLIEKLEQGIYDVDKGLKHSVLQTSYNLNTVYVNRVDNLACSYVRIGQNNVVIICVDKLNGIFKNSIRIVEQEKDKIEEYKEIVQENNMEFISNQNELISSLKGGQQR